MNLLKKLPFSAILFSCPLIKCGSSVLTCIFDDAAEANGQVQLKDFIPNMVREFSIQFPFYSKP